jgi:hypothetical protein
MNEAGGISPLDALPVNVVAKNLVLYLKDFTPQEVAAWFKTGKDMAAEIACPLTIPNFGVAKSVVRRYLASMDERFFEAVRYRISEVLPIHSALLGKDSVREWYFENMIRVRDRLLADLDAAMRKGAKPSEHRQNGGGRSGGGSGAGRAGVPGVLLPEKAGQLDHDLPPAVPDIDF